MNIETFPRNDYDRRTCHISTRKFWRTKNLFRNLKERIMGEEGKQKCNVVPQSLKWNGVGVEALCNGPHASLLFFWLFEFAKISMQNVRIAKANFALKWRSSKQFQMFVLYKHFTAFLYLATFSSTCIRCLRLQKRLFVLQNFLVEIWHVCLP